MKDIRLKHENGISCYLKAIDKEIHDIIDSTVHSWKDNPNMIVFDKFTPLDIVAYGDNKISEAFARKYIEHVRIPIIDSTDTKMSSRCYCFNDHNCSKSILHRSCLESWNCLMGIMNHPKYVLIYIKHETI